jgi:hypothetical protein
VGEEREKELGSEGERGGGGEIGRGRDRDLKSIDEEIVKIAVRAVVCEHFLSCFK